MQISNYINYLHRCEEELGQAFKTASKLYEAEPDVREMCKVFASWSLDHSENLTIMLSRYGLGKEYESNPINHSFKIGRTGSLGLLRDLHELWLMTNEVKLVWIILKQSAKALRDEKLKLACAQFGRQTIQQSEWLMMKIKHSAPQALTVPA